MGLPADTGSATESGIGIVYEAADGRPRSTGRVELADPCCRRV